MISGLLLALTSVLVPIIKLSNYTAQNGSIGIIGGADAPTLLFLLVAKICAILQSFSGAVYEEK